MKTQYKLLYSIYLFLFFTNGSFIAIVATIDTPCSSFINGLFATLDIPGSSFIIGSFATIDTHGFSFINGSFVSLDFMITYFADLSNSSAFLLSVELEVLKVSTQGISNPLCAKSVE